MPSLTEKQDKLLQHQAEIAKFRKERTTTEKELKSDKSSNKRPDGEVFDQEIEFLAAMGDIDHEKVRNAKSRFANEIQAEEYVASRQKVLELEKLEEQTNSRKRREEDDTKRLSKEWRCRTCSQNFTFKPKSCYKAGHDIATVRNIRKETSKAESRTELHRKRSEDGGLQLGAGLEWSGPFWGNRFLK